MSAAHQKEMIEESGRVTRLEGPFAVVAIARSSACEGCAAQGACTVLGKTGLRELRAVNRIDARPGDLVVVQVPASAALKAAAWVYLVPTLLMLATALGVHHWVRRYLEADRADLVAALASLAVVGLFALAVWLWRRRRGPDTRGYPLVVRRGNPA